jgi:hypothetical protein
VQGKRLEFYCNGSLALEYDKLKEAAGRVGIEVRGGTAHVSDVKFRPLPSDPQYERFYAAEPP